MDVIQAQFVFKRKHLPQSTLLKDVKVPVLTMLMRVGC